MKYKYNVGKKKNQEERDNFIQFPLAPFGMKEGWMNELRGAVGSVALMKIKWFERARVK